MNEATIISKPMKNIFLSSMPTGSNEINEMIMDAIPAINKTDAILVITIPIYLLIIFLFFIP